MVRQRQMRIWQIRNFWISRKNDIESSTEDIESNDSDVEGTPGEAVLTSGSAETTVAQAKVTREQVRAENKETLQGIIDNTNLSDAEKQSAVDQLVQMTEIAEQEAAIETLMASKGFSESVVSLDADSADVVVKQMNLRTQTGHRSKILSHERRR